MAYSEELSDRVRKILLTHDLVMEEKRMFGGLCFMIDGKMCIGIVKEELMCRLNPDVMETVLEKQGCREMDFTGKSMKGFVYVDETGFTDTKELMYWVNLCLEYNPIAKASKPKKKNNG